MKKRRRYYKYEEIEGQIFLTKGWYKGGKQPVKFPIARKDERIDLQKIEAIQEREKYEYEDKYLKPKPEIRLF